MRPLVCLFLRFPVVKSCNFEADFFSLHIALQVPVGRATLGRIINVIGEAIDEKGELSKNSTTP